MAKNKVVVFDENMRARVFITDNPESVPTIPGDTVLVNPELSYVKDCPIEFWKLENSLVVPMGESETAMRLSDLTTKSFISKQDHHIRENLSNLVDIPTGLKTATERLELYKDMLWARLDDNHETIIDSIVKNQNVLDGLIYTRARDLRSDMAEKHMKIAKIQNVILLISVCTLLAQVVAFFMRH